MRWTIIETDETLVVRKSQKAINSYGVHLVVANQLQTRRDVVQMVDAGSVTKIERGSEVRIDDKLVNAVADRFLSTPDRDCLLAPAIVVEVDMANSIGKSQASHDGNKNDKQKVGRPELGALLAIGTAALLGIVVGRLSK